MSRYITVADGKAPLPFKLRRAENDAQIAVIMLHGMSGDENVMWSLESALPPDALIVSPRGLHPQPQGGYAWNPMIKAWPPLVSEFSESVDRLADLIHYLEAKYTLNRAHIVLMGFSNGAAMSFAAAMTPMSVLPQGIIAVAGHLPEGDLAPLREIPVYWGHGTRDTFIPIEVAVADVGRLRDLQIKVTFCEADVGHKLGAQCLRNLKSWFGQEFPAAKFDLSGPSEGDK